MHPEQPEPALREELRQVEEELADLRRSAADIRQEVGGREDGAVDGEDTTVLIDEAEEVEALADTLEQRRQTLTERLAGKD